MIQRIQSLFLLGSIFVCLVLYFLPIGLIEGDASIVLTPCTFSNSTTGEYLGFNWLLSSVLSIIVFLQFISIFLFKNRNRQAMLVQVSLILVLVFVFLALFYDNLIPKSIGGVEITGEISYTWNVILMAISWIFTYLALRSIKKDEALVRAADRMR